MKKPQEECSPPRFTLADDDRIIEGFFANRATMFRQLQARGFSQDEVELRIEQLGLSDRLLEKCSAAGATIALRECLGCSARFVSIGIQNRLCRRCRVKC